MHTWRVVALLFVFPVFTALYRCLSTTSRKLTSGVAAPPLSRAVSSESASERTPLLTIPAAKDTEARKVSVTQELFIGRVCLVIIALGTILVPLSQSPLEITLRTVSLITLARNRLTINQRLL